MKTSHIDVLVVGAGPTGLTMSAELARHGIYCRIIDKAPLPSQQSKAFGIHARTLEIFENMGIIEAVLSMGNQCQSVGIYDQGRPLTSIQFDHIHTNYPYFFILAQSDTERILTRHLESFGISIEREKTLKDFTQNEAGVEATVELSDGTLETIHCRYLVGNDGAHSRVREILTIPFKGERYPNHWLLADCDIVWKYPKDELAVFFHKNGATAYFPLYGDRGRLMFELADAPIDTDLDEPVLEDVIRYTRQREIDFDVIKNPSWLAYFKLHHRIVDTYQKGRVFIGGDAAHIHSPVGGQGMNTGIQDAYNLAWKMALVLKEQSKEILLESYTPERKRIGDTVVGLTDKATRMISVRNPLFHAIRRKLLPFVTRLEPVKDRIIGTLSQIAVNYKQSPIVEERWPRYIETLGEHDLHAGERMEDYSLSDIDRNTHRLYEILKSAKHELILFPGLKADDSDWETIRRIHEKASEHYSRLIGVHLVRRPDDPGNGFSETSSIYIDKEDIAHNAYSAHHATAYLIRPDGYIAYRSQPAEWKGLEQYLEKIFG